MATKTCEQCKNKFELSVIIEGEKRSLKNRTLCLDCKPFNLNLSNRAKQKNILKPKNKKQCNNCKLTKDLSQFNSNHDKRYDYECYRSVCKDCQKIKRNERNNTIKEILKKELGCSICGYNKCMAAIDFHHTDPTKKEYEISSMIRSNMSIFAIKKELKKCIVLCANCHRELHYNERQNEVE